MRIFLGVIGFRNDLIAASEGFENFVNKMVLLCGDS